MRPVRPVLLSVLGYYSSVGGLPAESVQFDYELTSSCRIVHIEIQIVARLGCLIVWDIIDISVLTTNVSQRDIDRSTKFIYFYF